VYIFNSGNIIILCSNGEVWKSYRSNAAKQVIPRRVGNFVEPLSVIAEELLSHLETLQDEEGNVQDLTGEIYKWAFQGEEILLP
jgi:cytochrome P450